MPVDIIINIVSITIIIIAITVVVWRFPGPQAPRAVQGSVL